MKPALLAFGLGPALVALGEASVVEPDIALALKVGGTLVTLTAFAYGVKHMAEGARRVGEAADQKATSCFRKLDSLIRDFHDSKEHVAQFIGEIKGELGAWKERLKAVGDGVHATRTELGNRITRLEDRLDAMQGKD